ncbi:hypothetical protein KBJ98_14975 [Flavobacterium sp. F-328]|uniref:Tissue inhibitor of metalloproteinase n=1 Tax=Flavobacterium erciyesense TaxID=2825842 RepID=A0ABS5D7J7_9FLAO|nr:hypothetical protein [Flavobacterium erciyesense]MBQ0910013.1 hypothetical protein [Flavobacterium erciyesense]
MKQLLIFILSLFAINSYSNDCKTISKEKEYNNSDCILLGKITFVNDSYFEIKVLEVYKGGNFKKIRSYIGHNSIYPDLGETWLLYFNKSDKNDFYVSGCSNSRSFERPFIDIPPPPFPKTDPYFNELNWKTYFKLAILELNLDISKLRQVKTQNKLSSVINNYEILEKQMTLIKLLLIVIVVLLGYLFFRCRNYQKEK